MDAEMIRTSSEIKTHEQDNKMMAVLQMTEQVMK